MYDALMTRLNYWLNLDANEKTKILLERQEMIMKKKEDVENAEKKGYMEVSPHCKFAPWRKTRSPPPSPVRPNISLVFVQQTYTVPILSKLLYVSVFIWLEQRSSLTLLVQ